MTSEPSTPLMRQYHAVKQQTPNALLFFRLGDFFEMFFEDAVTASRELEITLTSRNKEKGEPIPMCGVPAHSAENYIARLLQKGYRVAICDQVEDPKTTKQLVKREITRIVTPGTTTEASVLRAGENNYLAAMLRREGRAGVAYADITTGEFRATEIDASEVTALLEQLNVKELLAPDNSPPAAGESAGRWLRTEVEAWTFASDYAERSLLDHFHLHSLDGCGLSGHTLAVCAAGALLQYARETQRGAVDHLEPPTFFDRGEAMVLDVVTVRNLELVEPLFASDAGGAREATLLNVINLTSTGMGARLLRRRLLRPSMDRAEIEARLDAAEELLQATILRSQLRNALKEVGDLERLLAKITIGNATPRELLALGRSLDKLPRIRTALSAVTSERMRALREGLDEVPEVRDRILAGISDEPPVNLNDGGVIREGFHEELDELRALNRNSKQIIAGIEMRERARTGIQSLKVRFNNVFGYYIEVSKANLHLAPDDYQRKQTLVNAERFITPELKELETKILEAEERILNIEREQFAGAFACSPRLRPLASRRRRRPWRNST